MFWNEALCSKGSFEGVDQGDPPRRELLVQLAEEHGTLVPLLGLAKAVEQPGLEIKDIPELLLTVHLGKIGFGFVEVQDS